MSVGIRPPVPLEASRYARDLATQMMSAVEAEHPRLFDHYGVDLAPAVGQMLFLAIRSLRIGRREDASTSLMAPLGRLMYAHALAMRYRALNVAGGVAAIMLNPAHAKILRPIEASLAEKHGPRVIPIWDGPLRADIQFPPLPAYLPLGGLRHVVAAFRHVRPALRTLSARWQGMADEAVIGVAASALRRELHRAIVDAACLQALFDQRPAVVVTFDEIGRRARLVGPIAAEYRIPSLDLPHAEAADPAAIRGATYDMFGVFGPRSREVLIRAGISPERIRELGPSRFDALVKRAPGLPVSPRRVVFASQWLGGQMTPAVKRETIGVALQAMTAAAPCEFVVAPHPLEQDRIADEVLATGSPPGVVASVDRSRPLHDLLDGAWALVTGWSNAAFEALLANVPVICITMTKGESPTAFVDEGLAMGATSVEEAQRAIASLHDEHVRSRLLNAGRSSLTEHLGPLDGRASERAASLILEMAGPGVMART